MISKIYQDTIQRTEKVGLINLGCARNLVDGQTILGGLKKAGYQIVEPDAADVVIINTCGFIQDAKQESIDTILDVLELKKQGKVKKVIVAGCLTERYKNELAEEFKGEVDAFVGVQQLNETDFMDQMLLTPDYSAYVKICESCYNLCHFCIIPKIKGKFMSRSMEDIVQEVRNLDQKGVKEINVIGQDITAYGMDLYGQKKLAELLIQIDKACPNIRWIRLLYTYPSHITDELLNVMAEHKRVCKYIDLPLQHVSDKILKNMNRKITRQETEDLVRKIRAKVPHAVIRTTFIVGLPGETEQEFNELCAFVKEFKFERMGVFAYSPEEGTTAYDMPEQVPDEVKTQRLDKLMALQQDISKEVMRQFVGQTVEVLIEEPQDQEGKFYLGRSPYDAPEVDGNVHVYSTKALKPGDFVTVRITDATEYDLAGETA
ncbi:MAG: 30S ribosomal protein S12 methylthiotransferase RimO [Candidatus Omnitrophica bacterium]|nr:30S ribosomal protein S12 methylthiotransferase RimO [Candidatus Omnitrophota bacterium]